MTGTFHVHVFITRFSPRTMLSLFIPDSSYGTVTYVNNEPENENTFFRPMIAILFGEIIRNELGNRIRKTNTGYF